MTPVEIVNAYRGSLELSNIVLPYKEARGVAHLKKRLEKENDIVAETEKAMAEQHGGKPNLDGTYSFGSPEEAGKFREALSEFRKQNDEIDLPMVDLSKHTSLLRLSPSAVEALDGIVIFESEADNGG